MSHIDEHTLELFILCSASVSNRRDAITKHLEECAGCRELAAEIERYYHDAADEVRNGKAPSERVPGLPLRVRPGLTPVWQAPHSSVAFPLRRPRRIIRDWTRRHPVASVSGTIVLAVGIVAIAGLILTSLTKHRSLAYFHINPAQQVLEAYDQNRKILWTVPGVGLSNDATGQRSGALHEVQIGTIEGRTGTVLVTTLPLVAGTHPGEWALRIFNEDGTLVLEQSLDRMIQYRGRRYDSKFGGGWVWLNGKDIFYYASNHRSPCYVARLRGDGTVVGEYWHHGALPVGNAIPFGSTQKPVLVLAGEDDYGDSLNTSFAAVTILDPDRMAGTAQSSQTPGYGLPAAQCEEYYLRFPKTDIEGAIDGTSAVVGVSYVEADGIGFMCDVRANGAKVTSFEYLFSRSMVPLEVKSISGGKSVHDKLKEEGKVSSTFDKKYLEKLEKEILFWDGRRWSVTPIGVCQ